MSAIEKIEEKRLLLQSELDNKKTKAERNKLGQFSTPPVLAYSILKRTLDFFGSEKKIKFIDPAFGTGAFGGALLKLVDNNRIIKALGCEIDKHYWEPSKILWEDTKIEYKLCDFTTENPKDKFNFLICNPPYVRHHHINGQKEQLKSKVFTTSKMNLSGLSGLYSYFIGLSHAWLEEGAISAWLIPSEFMNVKYGEEIEKYLLKEVELLQVHRFDPKHIQFDDALVSSAVVWFKNRKPKKDHEVLFTYGGSIESPQAKRMVPLETLFHEKKWTRFPLNDKRQNASTLRLKDYFDIKRGIATGANTFFILSEEEILQKELPIDQFKPILPSPRYIKESIIEADEKGFPAIQKRLFVIDSHLTLSEIEQEYPTFFTYLQECIKKGINKKFLCSKRKVWYSQEQRKPSMFYCTYIGRTTDSASPFRFILNRSNAIVSNSYQNLYPKDFVLKMIEKNHRLADRILEELSKIAGDLMIGEGRVYGGGMHKLEPKELANVPANGLLKILGTPK